MKFRYKYGFLLACALPIVAAAQGFQGIPWQASVKDVSRVFPGARQETLSVDLDATCSRDNGTTYQCTVAQKMCQSFGRYCRPPWRFHNYQVGPRSFDVSFNFGKSGGLVGVDLTMQGAVLDKPVSGLLADYASLYRTLEGKYGAPYNSEVPERSMGRSCSSQTGCIISGIAQWRASGTSVTLRVSGTYNRDTMRFTKGYISNELSISYAPSGDEASERL